MATLKYKNPATSAWETLDALPAIGQTVEITATELTGKSTADRAAMYAAGTRLLKVINNDTEVLLGLDADGSTEWLGSNKPLNNLLDNSDFEIAQAGYGGNHGTQAYACDRWKLISGTVSHGNAGLALNGIIAQVLENAPSEPVTAAASAGTITYDASAKTVTIATTEATIIAWAALYEGSYTADTLPPYTPKGYAAELAECQRYYWQKTFLQYETISLGFEGKEYGFIQLSAPREMRIREISFSQSAAVQCGNATHIYTGAKCIGTEIIAAHNYTQMSNPAYSSYAYCPSGPVTLAFSADL